MQRTIELLYDALGTKREQLAIAAEKREAHIKDLCSQHQAINSLKNDIERLETDLKNLHNLNNSSKIVGETNGCSLSPGTSELKSQRSNS